MSNISRSSQPNSIDLTAGLSGASIGASHAITDAVSVGAEVGSDHHGARLGANATAYIFPDKNFSPTASLRYNFGFAGDQGTYQSLGVRAGAEYRFNSGFSVGAYAGFDRALSGRQNQPWGGEVGISAAIHF